MCPPLPYCPPSPPRFPSLCLTAVRASLYRAGKILSLRKRPGVLTVSKIGDEVLVAECTDDAWENLWAVAHDVYVVQSYPPTRTRDWNRPRWLLVIWTKTHSLFVRCCTLLSSSERYMPVCMSSRREVSETNDLRKLFYDFQKLYSTIKVARGGVSGQFVVPDAPTLFDDFVSPFWNLVDEADTAAGSRTPGSSRRPSGQTTDHVPAARDNDRERVHLLESAVVGWIKSIKGLLKRDGIPEHYVVQADESNHPGPLLETEIRQAVASTFASVVEQLETPQMQAVSESLHM